MIRARAVFVAVTVVLVGAARAKGDEGTGTTGGRDATATGEDRADLRPDPEASYWAFAALAKPLPPAVTSRERVRNPIDLFVLARLQSAGLEWSKDADRRTLIRRATLTLHGLPPSAADVQAFLADRRPAAYERLIDRLLASPRYGERWARHWLDLVRYAESDGYKSDNYRPGAWHYRDWVIDSLNEDKPFDRFASEQLAGDELDTEDSEALVATGYLRHWPYEDNGRTLPEMWQTILDDVTNTTGSVFLGLTLGCARCHDHKFDPISRRDYYGFQAFFTTMAPRDDIAVAAPAVLAEHRRTLERWQESTSKLRAELEELESPYWRRVETDKAKKFPAEVQRIAEVPPEQRTVLERQIMMLGGPELQPSEKEVLKLMPGEVKARRVELQMELAKFDALRPQELPRARGVGRLRGNPPRAWLPGGEGVAVEPAFLPAVDSKMTVPLPARGRPAPDLGTESTLEKPRMALARWITSARNPLTSRVLANRLWQYHFGRGLVSTASDFGHQGTPPSHPQLLDWLAAELIEHGWSLKHLHRLILTSTTYRQAGGEGNAIGERVDPGNRLFWRRDKQRIEAEVLRDAILATSGELQLHMHGKSVLPELPEGISARYAWKPTESQNEQRRRSVYLIVKRNLQLPLLKSFDLPDNHESCARRAETTTATQALVLLNSQWVLEQAQAFAGRLLSQVGSKEQPFDADEESVLTRAYEEVYGRPPSERELGLARTFLENVGTALERRTKRGEEIPTPLPLPAGVSPEAGAALVAYLHALWNTNEFVYVD